MVKKKPLKKKNTPASVAKKFIVKKRVRIISEPVQEQPIATRQYMEEPQDFVQPPMELPDDEDEDELPNILPELQPQRFYYTVEQTDDGQRLDVFLQNKPLELSRTRIQDLIESFLVKVNDKVFKASYHVQTDDRIEVVIPAPEPINIEPEEYPLKILYEDEDIIVINKDAGVTVHPVVGQYKHTLVNYVLAHCKDLSGIGGKLRPGVVHRLDKDTAGIMVMAKNDQAHWGLSEQFKNRTVEKMYYAVVKGVIPYEDGFIRRSIIRDPRNRKRMAAVDDYQIGKPSETLYWVLERFDVATFVRVKILTGRTHQIRVHFLSIKHPLFGDTIYLNSFKALDRYGLALCSKELRFSHPRTGQDMYFQVDFPEHFNQLLEELRKNHSGKTRFYDTLQPDE